MAIVACLITLSSALDAAQREILFRRTFWAVAWTESSGDPRAFNRRENAAGIVQIRPIMLRDANRIIGYPKWSLADRFDVEKSYAMFRLVCRYYENKGGAEQWSRLWNAGPDWRKNRAATDRYWAWVQAALSR